MTVIKVTPYRGATLVIADKPRGPQGPAGTAATVAVGTVTTGAPGSSAAVNNTGTSTAAVFDIAIPEGMPGALPPGTHAARPASAVAGQTYRETDTGRVFVWSGSAWVEDTRLAASTDYADPLSDAATVQEALVRAPSSRVHRRDGTAGWSKIPISQDAGDDPTAKPHILSVTGGRLRIAADPTMTYNNRREVRVLDGTDGWVDSEIRSTWYPPSILASPVGCRPQMGHVHRATATGGAIVDQDQAATWSTTWVAAWGWTGTSLTLGSAVASTGSTRKPLKVRGYQRLAGSPATVAIAVDDVQEVTAGDQITVSGTGNAQFDGDWIVVSAVPVGPPTFPSASLILSDPVNSTAVAATPAPGGSVVYRALTAPNSGDDPRAWYPFHAASRLIGTVLSAKKWRVGTPEPPWGTAVLEAGCSWETDLAASTPALPSSGKCGVIANHLRGWGPRSVTDGVTTSGSKTITSATAHFGYWDKGATITGTGIPAGATVSAVNDTTATLSAAATSSGTGRSWTIGTAQGAYVEYGDIEVRQL
jgi:hypothetical protein